jgi:hypothetical protein
MERGGGRAGDGAWTLGVERVVTHGVMGMMGVEPVVGGRVRQWLLER